MSELTKNYRSWMRKKYLINPHFQLRFIAFSLLASGIAISSLFLTSQYFFSYFTNKGLEIGLASDHVFFVFLNQQQAFMNQLLIALGVFLSLGLFVLGLVMSHRVAGPLYRLHNHMMAVADGEVKKEVKFRKKDYFQELADSYNKQFEYLTGKDNKKEEESAKNADPKDKISKAS